jgi:hypothetical protein
VKREDEREDEAEEAAESAAAKQTLIAQSQVLTPLS